MWMFSQDGFKMTRFCAALVLGFGVVAGASAADFENAKTLNKSGAEDLNKDFGAAFGYRNSATAYANGILGFEAGLSVFSTTLHYKDAYQQADKSNDKTIAVPQFFIRKGLPGGFGVSATVSPVAGGMLAGVDGSVNLTEGGITSIASELRLGYSTLLGQDNVKFQAVNVEVAAAKTFGIFTPYIGAGVVTSKTTIKDGAKTDWKAQSKVMLGGDLSFGIGGITVYGDQVGSTKTVGLKLNFGI